MGWFDNQIKDRKLQDNAALEDAFAEIANSVSGKRNNKAERNGRYARFQR